jgi:hypothetical protein
MFEAELFFEDEFNFNQKKRLKQISAKTIFSFIIKLQFFT